MKSKRSFWKCGRFVSRGGLLLVLLPLALLCSSCEPSFKAPATGEIVPSLQPPNLPSYAPPTPPSPLKVLYSPTPIETTITLHVDEATTAVKPFWIDCIGTCNGVLWGDRTEELGRQLAYVRNRLGVRQVRFHNILSLVPKPQNGAYDFSRIDQVYDAIRATGARPLVEVSFMPPWLASGTKTVFDYKANVTPPRDMAEWKDLVTAFARHLEKRYGKREVRRWPFEIWNEPDLSDFWAGSNNWDGSDATAGVAREDYYQLYVGSREALVAADRKLTIGGPSAALCGIVPYGGLLQSFLRRVDEDKTPLDFISWHIYGAAYDKGKYTIRGTAELRSWIDDIYPLSKERKVPLLITEWNTTPTPEQNYIHDESLNAAFALNIIREVRGKCDLFSYWTMSDLFAEHGVPTSELSGGFGLLSLRGLEKPTFKAFEMLSLTRGAKWIAPREGLDAQTLASWDPKRKRLVVIIWNWPYDKGGDLAELKANPRNVKITISGLAKQKYLGAFFPLDQTRANMTTAWRAMGSPPNPSPEQRAKLEQASRLLPVKVEKLILADKQTQLTWKARLAPGDCCALVLTPKEDNLKLDAWPK